jgi:hypothetical protein
MSRPDSDVEQRKLPLARDAAHRRRTSRQERHAARARLNLLCKDGVDLDDAVLPIAAHDLGRKASPRARKEPEPGRRPGFKVWKTPFWKRRRRLWQQRNAAERRLSLG